MLKSILSTTDTGSHFVTPDLWSTHSGEESSGEQGETLRRISKGSLKIHLESEEAGAKLCGSMVTLLLTPQANVNLAWKWDLGRPDVKNQALRSSSIFIPEDLPAS